MSELSRSKTMIKKKSFLTKNVVCLNSRIKCCASGGTAR